MTIGSMNAYRGGGRLRVAGAVLAAALLGGCNLDLNLTNPNAPTEAEVLNSIDGVLALSLGMQEQFAGSIHHYLRAPALVTDEWGTQQPALAADQALFAGGNIDASFGVVSEPYGTTYRVIRSANNLLTAADNPNLQLGRGLQVGLRSTANLFKAMALGMAIQNFERVPIDIDAVGAVPQERAVVLAEVLRLLEAARADLATVTDAELAVFRTRALSPGFDLRNTVEAMLARYSLIAGQHQNALAAAGRVNQNVVSVFTFPAPTRNPINNYSFGARYVAGLQRFVREAEPDDQRPSFWLNTTSPGFLGNPPTDTLLLLRQYAGNNDPFPVYLPGEMLLIMAEAQARLGNLEQARARINQVRTKAPTATTPGAQLPALTAAQLPDLNSILRQIAYERRYELYMQGLRWEDLRRLGQFAGRQPKAAWLPLPERECRTNPVINCP
jgi:starch-binding outer membrane protein, SusD/RagB family